MEKHAPQRELSRCSKRRLGGAPLLPPSASFFLDPFLGFAEGEEEEDSELEISTSLGWARGG